MSQYNLANNHPLIPNANEYLFEKKYVSIHSSDRDCIKYPNSAQFEIELPQDYVNVQSIKLIQWSFPTNYNVFSIDNNNLEISFQFIEDLLYNPAEHGVSNPLLEAIFAGLYANISTVYTVTISAGSYTPSQMANELTNRFNTCVYKYLSNYIGSNYTSPLKDTLLSELVYFDFVITFNEVQNNLWFGHKNSGFKIISVPETTNRIVITNNRCVGRRGDSYENWGLTSFLGFGRNDETSLEVLDDADTAFFYRTTDVYWLESDASGASCFYVVPPFKVNLAPQAYIYLEIDGLNCLDETAPFSASKFTAETNQTNSIINSAFAKIPMRLGPGGVVFDDDMIPYKWYNPPAERIRRLRLKFRYHNQTLVNFNGLDYSFMLEFNTLRPQSERKMSVQKILD